MISQLISENKMLRELSLNTNKIHYHKKHSAKHKDKNKIEKRKNHWDESKHNRSDTTIKLNDSNSLNTTAINNNYVNDNSIKSNSSSSSNISSSHSNANYSGQFGNSNLYLKVRK